MTTPPRIGIQLPEVEYDYTWPQLLEIARTAEDIGLDSIWYGDHLMYRHASLEREPKGPFESWTTLAALAANTSRVQLGHLVASLGFHQPAMIAKMASTIDGISNGRFVLGVGAGWHKPEYDGYGFPFDHRFGRFNEAYHIIRMLFTTGECTFHGTWYQMDQCLLFPRPVQPGGPPIMVGSVGERMLEATLPSVAMWNAWSQDYGNTADGLRQLLERVDRIAERVGRDPSTLVKTVAPLVRMPGGSGRASEYGAPKPLDGTDPARLAASLNELAELGIAHVQLVLDPITPATVEALSVAVAELRG